LITEVTVLIRVSYVLVVMLMVACVQRPEPGNADYGEPDGAQDASQRAKFIYNVQSLQIGDTLEAVKAVLGSPTRRMLVSPKVSSSPQHEVLVYYLSAYTPGSSNVHDEFVSLSFDAKTLAGIVSTVPEIPSRPKNGD
jgi:hypothetical protein